MKTLWRANKARAVPKKFPCSSRTIPFAIGDTVNRNEMRPSILHNTLLFSAPISLSAKLPPSPAQPREKTHRESKARLPHFATFRASVTTHKRPIACRGPLRRLADYGKRDREKKTENRHDATKHCWRRRRALCCSTLFKKRRNSARSCRQRSNLPRSNICSERQARLLARSVADIRRVGAG